MHQHQPRTKNPHPRNHRPSKRAVPGVQGSQAPQEHSKVEVRARKRLDQRKPDQEIAGLHPALGHDVFAEQGDDDGAAAKDDGAGEVHVGEEAVEEGRRRREGAAQD